MSNSLFSENFKETPYWWDRAPRSEIDAIEIPKFTDVLIVGSGYTGLSAAIQTARHGRHTVVVDAESAGWGCSSRNGGQVSTNIKPQYTDLVDKFGRDCAFAIMREGQNALDWIEKFILENGIDCDFKKCGRFHGAHDPRNFDVLRARLEEVPDELNVGAYVVHPEDQYSEVDSDFYYGGVVSPHHASIDPGRYHQGMLNVATNAGVEIVSHCQVKGIDRNGGELAVRTSHGVIKAGEVIVATSGYTGKATPWQQKRIIPIGSYMIATEPLEQGLPEKLMPTDRVITDTLKVGCLLSHLSPKTTNSVWWSGSTKRNRPI